MMGLGTFALAWPRASRAQQQTSQQPAKTKRIATVSPKISKDDAPYAQVFREELDRFGYVKDKTLIIDSYSGEGRTDHYEDLAREVVSTNPDVIVSYGTPPLTLRLKAATGTIPIVAITGDPIRFGIVSNIARPGGNITGVSVDAGVEIWGKRLELLAEAVPKLVNVNFISTAGGWLGPGGRAAQVAAQKLGISLVNMPLGQTVNEAEYRRIFDSIRRDEVDGIMISDEVENNAYRMLLVKLVQQLRIPAIYNNRDQAEAGGLMSYSYDLKAAVRRQATQVAEILRGANPGEIPYFQEARFELVINLKTAKELGLEIPAGLVAGATVIE
jgi:putative ABC transport system substrate-binding protein